jgi:two-component system chemotaxis response regulator CheB
MNKIYLYPGKLAAEKIETEITTLLGSCVAVALYDPVTKVGGLNHYLLPNVVSTESPNPRYGSIAIPELLHEMEKLGALKKNIQAKVYGGGNVISSTIMAEGIGARNIEIALRMLAEFKIPVLEKNVGGDKGRKIILNTKTFEVRHALNGEKFQEQEESISGFRKPFSLRSVKVLIIDDSATVRNLFSNIFTKNGLEVVGVAHDPYEARDLLMTKKPDVITLDIEMPKMNGVTFLEKLMKHQPTPVVMVSSLGSQGDAALRSLELGAVEFVHKPSQFDPSVLSQLGEMLVQKVRAAASVNIVKKLKEQGANMEGATTVRESKKIGQDLKVVVVGGNAGSADSIGRFIQGLEHDTPPVIVSCSTITPFLDAFISKIKSRCKVGLSVAKGDETLSMGKVYFIPSGVHGKVVASGFSVALKLEKGMPVNSQLPSANVLFKSAAMSFGAGVYAVQFGGFGNDGCEGLESITAKGGATCVQTPDEAQFPYGPQSSIEMGVAGSILTVSEIPRHLFQYRSKAVA